MFRIEICGGDYKFLKIIGKGGFGKVYEVEDVLGIRAAVKVVKDEKLARNEYKILQILEGVKGVPRVFRFYDKETSFALSMELGGLCIIDPESGIDFKNIYVLADFAWKSIEILKNIHRRGIVHNDIKPHQFLISENRKIFLVDFGFSRRFKNGKFHKELKVLDKKQGNFLFASKNCHKGYSLSRRDDLISLGYMLIYLYKGALPWESCGNINNPADKWDKAYGIKKMKSVASLCKGMPSEFSKFLEYSISLEYSKKPDYRYLISIFKDLSALFSSKSNTNSTNASSSSFSTKDIGLTQTYFQLAETEVIDAPEFKLRVQVDIENPVSIML
ncbi:hypothetical protein SteCoe_9817 [Stentor coeruleus]|uniref:Casein kinase I n=1 Tax=Stentor coeruleus TaxID=5963 RepID=A0A1R2CH38_9CILI|nr:hypothetical protein SteCoe_9817 [Stentor coeruleus]